MPDIIQNVPELQSPLINFVKWMLMAKNGGTRVS